MVEIVLPNDANVLGNMLGGRVMHLIDIAGALAANRHSNSHVVTASVDYLDFRFPIRVGEWIVLKSSVNRVFHTSMEVGVKVFAENILTGERRHTSTAYVTFVALDSNQQAASGATADSGNARTSAAVIAKRGNAAGCGWRCGTNCRCRIPEDVNVEHDARDYCARLQIFADRFRGLKRHSRRTFPRAGPSR